MGGAIEQIGMIDAAGGLGGIEMMDVAGGPGGWWDA